MVFPTAATFYLYKNVRKRAAKPSAGNTSAMFPRIKWTQILLNLTPEPSGFSGTFSRTFSGTFFGTLLNLTWLCTKASQTSFSRTLLNVTWLCTKASQTFSGTFGTFSGTSLNLTRHLHQCTPELFWAEDPPLAYAVREKMKIFQWYSQYSQWCTNSLAQLCNPTA